MTTKLLLFISVIFDKLQQYWDSRKNHRLVGSLLGASFIISLIISILNTFNLLPPAIAAVIPSNKFFAINIAFTLLLLVEIVGLVFAIARSVSTSLIKQFEIFSLILLRSAFKQFGNLNFDFDWQEAFEPISAMLSDAFGALVIFVIILLISKIQKHTPITSDPVNQTRFILFKKNSALLLFILFIISGIIDISLYLRHGEIFDFFSNFYTILIFNDILLVLISLRYNYSYLIVFRNSAFAVATLIIRMALTAPPYFNAVLGILASVFGLGVVYFYNKYVTFSLLDEE
ncbi:MAG: hypothetical protein J7K39_08080 [Bacteroidales bacterium]|nr:hypothetical protein [Bacteroidales bacterium]